MSLQAIYIATSKLRTVDLGVHVPRNHVAREALQCIVSVKRSLQCNNTTYSILAGAGGANKRQHDGGRETDDDSTCRAGFEISTRRVGTFPRPPTERSENLAEHSPSRYH